MTDNNIKRPRACDPETVDFHNPMQSNNSYDPKYCILLTDHISKGFSLNSFDVGVSSATIQSWLRTHEEFALARERGERRKLKMLEAAGIKMAVADGNATVWKTLISQYGVMEKSVTENVHHHTHEKVVTGEGEEEVIKLTGHEERLAKIRELSKRLGITAASEDVIDAEVEEGNASDES